MPFHGQDDDELGYEDALLLLDDLEEAVDDLEDLDEDDPERRARARELLDRLLRSFDELPLTSRLAREHLGNLESWGRVLLSDGEEAAGPGSIYQLLRDELTEVRGFLEYEIAT